LALVLVIPEQAAAPKADVPFGQGSFGRRMYETGVQTTAFLRSGRLKLDPLFGEERSFEEL
jgi:hypothetical protein